jgi:methionyl-tRNA formyltransferase
VKEVAVANNIPVEQPTSLRGGDATEVLRGYAPDCIVVAAYGMILPESVLNLPKHGCINVHASLLPKYRGAAPINRCIMNGERESGVTIMQMDAGLDTGEMLLSESITIGGEMTASELHDRLAEIGGRLVVQALDTIDNIGGLTHTKQDDALSTYAEKLTKSECEIDFDKSPEEILRHIRGLADYPCAFTHYDGKRLKVYRAVAGEGNGIVIGGVTLTEIQPEGGKRMKAADYLRGLQ